MDRPDKEKEIGGLIDKYLGWLRGDDGLFTMRMLLEEIIALFPDEEVRTCGLCGGKMSNNPHPDAGKPNDFLTVGTQYVCIPCECKNRHKWANRALEAEGQIEEAKHEEGERIYKEIEKHKRIPVEFNPLAPILKTGDIYIEATNWQALKEEK